MRNTRSGLFSVPKLSRLTGSGVHAATRCAPAVVMDGQSAKLCNHRRADPATMLIGVRQKSEGHTSTPQPLCIPCGRISPSMRGSAFLLGW
jgi:hypothetical protein